MQFKFFKALVVLAAIAGVANATPTPSKNATEVSLVKREGSVTFISTWVEVGLQRYRFDAYGVSDLNEFVHAFQSCRGITSNWQAWWDGDHGVFDDSEVQGAAGEEVIRCGIATVTGQQITCSQTGLC